MRVTFLFAGLCIVASLGHLEREECSARELLWQIGECDESADEFALARNYTGFRDHFPQAVVFVIGESDPSRDWPWIHPGPLDIWAESATHPYTIRFRVSEQPAGTAKLNLRFLSTHARVPPRFEATVNGISRTYPLPCGTGDITEGAPPPFSPRKLIIPFAAKLLRAGTNEVIFRCTSGSWLLYDCISLELERERYLPPSLQARVTPLLVEENGELRQVVILSSQGGVALAGDADLEICIGDARETRTLSSRCLGPWETEITVPVVPQETEVTCSLTIHGEKSATQSAFRILPPRLWTFFVAPSSHVDIGYTHLQPECAAIHSRNLDEALEVCQEHPDLFHWNSESAWTLLDYEGTRSPEEKERLAQSVRGGCVTIGAMFANMLTGLCSGEELCRSLYLANRYSRETDAEIPSAILTDAPSHIWSLPDVLSHAGIRHLSIGVNGTRAPKLNYGNMHAQPYWWEGQAGPSSRVLVMQCAGYAQAKGLGLHEDVERVRERILAETARREQEGYPHEAVHLHGAVSDNQVFNRRMVETLADWQDRYAYPRIILSGNDAFFREIEERSGPNLPIVRGCEGSWWEDGAASSAQETAINRANQNKVTAVEALWAMVSAVDPDAVYPAEAFTEVWQNILLYDEHTWGAHNSISHPDAEFVRSQFAIKAAYAKDARTVLAALEREGMEHLGSIISTKGPPLLVFNPHGQPYSGVIEVSLPEQMTVAGAQDNGETVSLVVKEIPPAGYRTYELLENIPRPPEPLTEEKGVRLENAYYLIEFNQQTGAVASLIDRETGRELVDHTSRWGLNEFIYCEGGENSSAINWTNPSPPSFAYSGIEEISIRLGQSGPVYRSVLIEGKGKTFESLSCEVRLHEQFKRIDFIHSLRRSREVYRKEAVYFAFPFALLQPVITYSIGGGAVVAGKDWVPGACKDWFAVRDWVRVSDGPSPDGDESFGIVWTSPDTPLIQLCDIQAGKWRKDLPITNGTVLAYAMNNYWYTNYKAGQSGEFVFRYSLTSGKGINRSAAAAFGRSVCAPPLAQTVSSGRGLIASEGSFLRIQDQGVVLQALKESEDGDGVILRLRDLAGKARQARVEFDLLPVGRTVSLNGLEKRLGEGPPVQDRSLRVDLRANALTTLKLLQTQ